MKLVFYQHTYFWPLTIRYSDRAVLASFLLKEELGHIGRVGCALCLIGSLIIVLNAPADKEVQTVDEILEYAVQPGAILPITFFV